MDSHGYERIKQNVTTKSIGKEKYVFAWISI